jgi:hypothetical protein
MTVFWDIVTCTLVEIDPKFQRRLQPSSSAEYLRRQSSSGLHTLIVFFNKCLDLLFLLIIRSCFAFYYKTILKHAY